MAREVCSLQLTSSSTSLARGKVARQRVPTEGLTRMTIQQAAAAGAEVVEQARRSLLAVTPILNRDMMRAVWRMSSSRIFEGRFLASSSPHPCRQPAARQPARRREDDLHLIIEPIQRTREPPAFPGTWCRHRRYLSFSSGCQLR